MFAFPNRQSLLHSTMEEEANGQATCRKVLLNVTLHQEGVTNENVLSLHRSRLAAKGSVTKKITEITVYVAIAFSSGIVIQGTTV